MHNIINEMIEHGESYDFLHPFKVESDSCESKRGHEKMWVIDHIDHILAALKDLQVVRSWANEQLWGALSGLQLELAAKLSTDPRVSENIRTLIAKDLAQIPGYEPNEFPINQDQETKRAYGFAIAIFHRARIGHDDLEILSYLQKS